MEKLSFMVEDRRFDYPCFELYQQFAPEVPVVFNEPLDNRIEVQAAEGRLTLSAWQDGQCQKYACYTYEKDPLDKQLFKGFLYDFLCECFDRKLDWGVLTGIKPVKWAHLFLKKGKRPNAVVELLKEQFKLSNEKAELITNIAAGELPFIYPLDRKRVSIYVGVPLCIAKCAYCSFISTILDKKGVIAETYLQNLLYEIRETAAYVTTQGLSVDTLYIGGGTPSVFTEEQTERLLKTLKTQFDLSCLREYTFEAGRPETTTEEKLDILKQYGVTRVCLNPQSMNADTLLAVGRRHRPEDIIRTYETIRRVGFDSVNMDLILGLNHEPPEAFDRSLKAVIALKPENITVHCLAIKKGSAIKQATGRQVENLYTPNFHQEIQQKLADAAYSPYYLYRQKYTQGNGENIGYCLPGKEGIYNMLMMAEKQSIIGIGAGSSGKLYDPDTDRFDKIFTVKDVRTYNERTEDIVRRKLDGYRQFFG